MPVRCDLVHYGEILGEVVLLDGTPFGDLRLWPQTAWVRELVARRTHDADAAAAYDALCVAADLIDAHGRVVPHHGLGLAYRPEELRLGVILELGPAEDGGAAVGALRRPPPRVDRAAVWPPEAAA